MRLDDAPAKPVRVTPEEFHRVAQQFSDAGGAESGVFRIRDNLWAGLAPAAGWAGVDDAALTFGEQFSAAFDQLYTGFDRAGQVLGDVASGIDISARNHWRADQAATPDGATDPPWPPISPPLILSTPQRPFPMTGNATVGGLGALQRKIPLGDPEKLFAASRAFTEARDVLDAQTSALHSALQNLFANNASEDLDALDEFWHRIGGITNQQAILTALRESCDDLARALSDFAAWIVDTQNQIVAAIESILKEILLGILLALALAAISGGLGGLAEVLAIATGAGKGAEIAIAVDTVLTAVNATGRLAAIGGAVGGVVGIMQVAIENTPTPNLSGGNNPKVTDEQITTEATSIADQAGGPAEVPGSAGGGEVPTPHGRPGTVNDLNPQQRANYERYARKLPAKAETIQVEILEDGGVRLSARVPANNIPGSHADYIKIVDKNGNTVQYVKNTYDANGNLVHSKIK